MDLKLTVNCEVEGQERSYDLEFAKEEITIGRSSGNDVQLPDMAVSSRHARILVSGESLTIEDLKSSNGTEVDGKRLEPHRSVPLSLGAEIRIVGYRIGVSEPEGELSELTAEKTDLVAMKMVREVLASFGGSQEPPYLMVENDEEKGTRLDLDAEEAEYRLGRDRGCDLTLRHWSISRRHALIRKSFDTVTVSDLESKNGVTVNGERLTGSRTLSDGDVVACGHTEIRFHHPSGGLADSMDGSSTPISSFSDIGLDMDAIVSGRASSEAPTPPAEKTGSMDAAEGAATGAMAAGDVGPAPRRRPGEDESSFWDYLPIVIGVLLAVAAVVAALVSFVF